MTDAEKLIHQMRLDDAFDTFDPNEPYDVTRQRRDRAKGFVDNSPEGRDLASIIQMQQFNNPRALFHLFDDGFHTPAMKQPSHPSFMLNDPIEKAISQMRWPNQVPGSGTTRNTIEQLLDSIYNRKFNQSYQGRIPADINLP